MHDKSEMLSSGGRGTGRDTQVSTYSAYLGPVDALQHDTEYVPLVSKHTLTRLLQRDIEHALLVSTHSTYPGPVDTENALLVSTHSTYLGPDDTKHALLVSTLHLPASC